MKRFLWMFILGIILVTGCSETEGKDSLATLQEFNRLEKGITYEEAVEIIGGKGKKANEDDDEIQHIIWDGVAPDSFVSASFRDNKLINKMQNGLK